MEILTLDHSALLVRDVDRSRWFYGEILAMDEVPRPETFDFPGAWFRKGTAEIHLIGEAGSGLTVGPPPAPAPAHPSRRQTFGTHIAFEVADLHAARRHLIERDIEIAGEPRPRGDGVMQMYIRDPDGYVVELFQWVERPAGGSV